MLRVAVIGARGFGRFHAQWYARLGCQVVAFVSSSPETVKQNAEALRKVVPGFNGRGYHSVEEMLTLERPDAVSVCSPPDLHLQHARLAINHHCHVLCEKPLVWLGADRMKEALLESEVLVKEVESKGRIFAINTQYASAWQNIRDIAATRWQSSRSLQLVMQARRKPQPAGPLDLWADLGPHPLSLLFRFLSDSDAPPNDCRCSFSDQSLTLHFTVGKEPERQVTIAVARASEPLERSLTIDGLTIRFEAVQEDGGLFRTRLVWNDGEKTVEDLMHSSVRYFVRAVLGEGRVLCDQKEALRQMQWLITLAQKGVISSPRLC